MKALLVLTVFVLGAMVTLLINNAIVVNLFVHYEFSQVIIHDLTFMMWGAATFWAINK